MGTLRIVNVPFPLLKLSPPADLRAQQLGPPGLQPLAEFPINSQNAGRLGGVAVKIPNQLLGKGNPRLLRSMFRGRSDSRQKRAIGLFDQLGFPVFGGPAQERINPLEEFLVLGKGVVIPEVAAEPSIAGIIPHGAESPINAVMPAHGPAGTALECGRGRLGPNR